MRNVDSMRNTVRFIAAVAVSMTIDAGTAFAHHPGVGGAGGAGGIFTIGAGTLDQGQFAFSAFIEYLGLNQLSVATLLDNIGNDVHGPQSIESGMLSSSQRLTHEL